MNSIQRFFHRYLLSTVGILSLFLLVNILLIGVIFGAINNSIDNHLPIGKLADMVTSMNGEISATQEFNDVLVKNNAWTMLLNDSGKVIWEERLPDDLPRRYTSMQIAKFSRWYLHEYPVYVWEHPSGLLVIGYPKDSIVKYTYSTSVEAVVTELIGPAMFFVINILLMLILFWHNTHRVEKAIKPILTGINQMAQGKPVSLPEKGELAEINAELNHAGQQLQKKDLARSEWISGISHDIRTPLSMILGYAGEIEDNDTLPGDTQLQAGIIRKNGEKLRSLVTNLNLASKLEYSMQPMKNKPINPVELSRQVMSDFINNNLDERYKLDLQVEARAENIYILGDHDLLARMLENLIQNSINHNTYGCEIFIKILAVENNCFIEVKDMGIGVSESLLARLNSTEIALSTQNGECDTAHGFGLKLVKQIVKAHKGEITFSNVDPHGLTGVIKLPINHRS